MALLAWVVGLIMIVGAAVAVLTRRERRRFAGGTDTHRIEYAATRGAREARRDTRVVREWSTASLVGALRDRDANGRA